MVNAEAQRRRVIDNQLNISAPPRSIYSLFTQPNIISIDKILSRISYPDDQQRPYFSIAGKAHI